jgi:hypothetical protein
MPKTLLQRARAVPPQGCLQQPHLEGLGLQQQLLQLLVRAVVVAAPLEALPGASARAGVQRAGARLQMLPALVMLQLVLKQWTLHWVLMQRRCRQPRHWLAWTTAGAPPCPSTAPATPAAGGRHAAAWSRQQPLARTCGNLTTLRNIQRLLLARGRQWPRRSSSKHGAGRARCNCKGQAQDGSRRLRGLTARPLLPVGQQG